MSLLLPSQTMFGLPIWLCAEPTSSYKGQHYVSFTHKSDKELLEYIQSKDSNSSKSALSALYQRYNNDVYRFVKSIVVDKYKTDELVSDVWFLVLEEINDFEWQEKPIKSWLFSIADIKCKEYFRLSKAEQNVCLEHVGNYLISEFDNVLASMDDNTDSQPLDVPDSFRTQVDPLLAEALEALKPIDQQVIELIYFGGKNFYLSSDSIIKS